MDKKVSPNNFDLIRLVAAAQVAALHVVSYLSPATYKAHSGVLAAIIEVLKLIPGVPIFFFISGFLISRSYERAASLQVYAANRCLRIYPALVVCVLINLCMVGATGYFDIVHAHFSSIALLFFAKATVLQFYNPQFMRHFGDGVLNGSLWTVCVELQFYILVPMIYRIYSRREARRFDLILLCLIVLSIAANRFLYGSERAFGSSDYWKLLRVSFIPWLYMFLTGVMAQRHFSRLSAVLSNNPLWVVGSLYLMYAMLMRKAGYSFDNNMSPVIFAPLSAVVLAAAYTAPSVSGRLLKGNDVSYGIYIYHVPIMDTLLYLGFTGSLLYSLITWVLTAFFAVASWNIIERPFLRKKRQSIHPVVATQQA